MRRLVALVVVVDLIGGGALAFALTRPAGQAHPHAKSAALVAHPTDPLTIPVSSTSTLRPNPSSKPTARVSSSGIKPRDRHRPHRTPVARHQTAAGCPFNINAARSAVVAETRSGYTVGFAVMTAAHATVLAVNANTPNYGASVTKSLLLVAYLREVAKTGLTAAASSELTEMIEVSDNEAANWVYAHLNSPAAELSSIAAAAGMTNLHLDETDPVYVLGQSTVTAHDLASYFAVIGHLMPARYRAFGMNLLAHVQERVGLLAAGLPGTVYSKEGWKPESTGLLGAPYVVDQAAQLTCRRVTYGIAVTVGHASDQTSAEAVVQRIASSLIGD